MSEENVEFVRDALAAWVEVDEGLTDPDRLNAFYAADAVFGGEILESEIRGGEAFLEWRTSWMEPYEDWSYGVDKVLDAGANRVLVSFHQRGKLRGSESWVDMRYAIVYTVKDGAITRAWVYATPEEALAAVGLSE